MERSPLARLPPELRIRIYECVVEDNRPIVLEIPRVNCTRTIRQHHRHPHGSFGLMYTCKQLHTEFLPIFYGHNTFSIPAYRGNAARRLRDFIDNTLSPRNMALLRQVEVNISDPWIYPEDKKFVQQFQKILSSIRRHGRELQKCEIRVVLDLGVPELPLALKPKSRQHMERSVADCIEQLLTFLKATLAAEGGDVPESWANGQGIPEFLSAVRDGMVYD